jgi:hypothetical protein
MKSSKDIPPRVGMQVRFWDNSPAKVTSVHGASGFRGTNGYATRGYAWNSGAYEIEWTPPTDDERRLFMEAADNIMSILSVWGQHECNGFCYWEQDELMLAGYDEQSAIAESLALDGADYDDMPDFEELER